jgi:hypothetical protein
MNIFEINGWNSAYFIDGDTRLATYLASQVADRHIVYLRSAIQVSRSCLAEVYNGDTEPSSERNSKSKHCASKGHALPTYDCRVVG